MEISYVLVARMMVDGYSLPYPIHPVADGETILEICMGSLIFMDLHSPAHVFEVVIVMTPLGLVFIDKLSGQPFDLMPPIILYENISSAKRLYPLLNRIIQVFRPSIAGTDTTNIKTRNTLPEYEFSLRLGNRATANLIKNN